MCAAEVQSATASSKASVACRYLLTKLSSLRNSSFMDFQDTKNPLVCCCCCRRPTQASINTSSCCIRPLRWCYWISEMVYVNATRIASGSMMDLQGFKHIFQAQPCSFSVPIPIKAGLPGINGVKIYFNARLADGFPCIYEEPSPSFNGLGSIHSRDLPCLTHHDE